MGATFGLLCQGKVVLDTYYTIYVQEIDEQFRLSGLPRESREEITDAMLVEHRELAMGIFSLNSRGIRLCSRRQAQNNCKISSLCACLVITVEAESF